LFDGYGRVARLYPAALALVPFMLFVGIARPETLLGEFPKNMFAVLIFISVFYLLATIARIAGKKIEPGLLARWGGWPTTLLLRYRDATVDRYTKARYHQALIEMCPDIAWPSQDDENSDAEDADLRYTSATNRLKERRRGLEHKLVHKENASYGFHRNLLGLRRLAIAIAAISAAIEAFQWAPSVLTARSVSVLFASVAADPRDPILIVVDLLIIAGWIIWVTEVQVRAAAVEYGHALLRTLDSDES